MHFKWLTERSRAATKAIKTAGSVVQGRSSSNHDGWTDGFHAAARSMAAIDSSGIAT
jgi:hypothetical protein